MQRLLYLFIVLCITFAATMAEATSPDLSSLVKVSPSTNAKCVDYYSYKGELYCSTTPQQNPEPIDPHLNQYERLNIVFDNPIA